MHVSTVQCKMVCDKSEPCFACVFSGFHLDPFLAVSEIMFFLIDLLKAVCKRVVTEAALLDRYGKLCLALDEFMMQVSGSKIHICAMCTVHLNHRLLVEQCFC